MTRDQKAALKGLGVFILVKATVWATIIYAAKVARDANLSHFPERHFADFYTGLSHKEDSDVVAGHSTMHFPR
jgi:hypothetical protein